MEHTGGLDQRFLWRGSGDSVVRALQGRVERLEVGSGLPFENLQGEQRPGKLVEGVGSRADFLDEKYCGRFSS